MFEHLSTSMRDVKHCVESEIVAALGGERVEPVHRLGSLAVDPVDDNADERKHGGHGEQFEPCGTGGRGVRSEFWSASFGEGGHQHFVFSGERRYGCAARGTTGQM